MLAKRCNLGRPNWNLQPSPQTLATLQNRGIKNTLLRYIHRQLMVVYHATHAYRKNTDSTDLTNEIASLLSYYQPASRQKVKTPSFV